MKRSAHEIPVSEVLSAIAEPVRVRMCRLLEREELSVGEIADVFQLPQSAVSRRLKTLSDAGWLLKRTEGPATLYRLVLDDLPSAARAIWIGVRQHLGDDPTLREDLRRLEAVLAQRMTDSQAFFGRVAGAWDDVRNELFGGFTPRALLGLLDPAATIIDAGCGTGNASELIAPFVRKVLAVDESAAMLKAARKRLAAFDNVEFVRAPLDALPFPDASADAAACVLVLHHLTDPAPALRELRRALRPSGRLLVVDMFAHDREEYRRTMGHKRLGFAEHEITDIVADAGFDHVRVVPLPAEPHTRGPGLFAATASRPSAR